MMRLLLYNKDQLTYCFINDTGNVIYGGLMGFIIIAKNGIRSSMKKFVIAIEE